MTRSHWVRYLGMTAAMTQVPVPTASRQKDIVRDVMRELGAGPRQMVRICGLTYAVVYKIWKDL